MKKFTSQILLLLIVSSFSSCKSVKDLTYFQDIADREIIQTNKNTVSEYKIRPTDNLYINIKTLDPEVNVLFSNSGQTGNMMTGTTQMYGTEVGQYINGFVVDSLGNIFLPIIGTVNIKNYTLQQTKEKIHSKALEFLQDPVVDVKLLSFRIQVNGEVRSPGVYYNYKESLTILDAISMAGGITDNAKLGDIKVLRQSNNRTEVYNMDLTKKDFFNSEAFYLYPYDIVYVKPGFNKKYDLNVQTYQLVLSTISTLVGLKFLYQSIY